MQVNIILVYFRKKTPYFKFGFHALGGHFVIACVCLYWYLWFYENWYLVAISCKFYLGFNKSAVAFPFFTVNPEITWETPEKLWSLKIKTWLNFKPDLKSFIDWNLDLIWRSLEPLIPGSKWATGNLISSQTSQTSSAVHHRTISSSFDHLSTWAIEASHRREPSTRAIDASHRHEPSTQAIDASHRREPSTWVWSSFDRHHEIVIVNTSSMQALRMPTRYDIDAS